MRIKIHFNRNNMQRGLASVWTIHTYKECIPATQIHIKVPVTTIFKPEARQPRAWFACEGKITKCDCSKFDCYIID